MAQNQLTQVSLKTHEKFDKVVHLLYDTCSRNAVDRS